MRTKLLGYTLIATPFAAIFILELRIIGPVAAVLTFVGTAAVVGLITAGAYLSTR